MNNDIKLSARMEAIASFVSKGSRVCDVGCDHGYIGIFLVKGKIAPFVLLMDINEGPLKRALKNTELFGLSKEQYEIRRSDGLSEYKAGEADTLIISGMGGALISDIISNDLNNARDFKELIFSPQSEIPQFRAFLRQTGLKTVDEEMVFEDGKYYVIMRCVWENDGEASEADDTLSRIMSTKYKLEDEFGAALLNKKSEIFKQYLFYRKEKCDRILCKLNEAAALCEDKEDERLGERKNELMRELELINKAIKYRK